MGKKENYVEKYLVDQAQKYDFLCYKFFSGVNGVPDRILIGNGHTVFVETKSDEGVLRDLQKRRIRHINEHGGEARAASSRDEVDTLLQYIENNPKEERRMNQND